MGKIGVKSFLIIGICAVLFIVLAKVAVNKFNIPGVSTVVNAV
jgi:hypothetical protein